MSSLAGTTALIPAAGGVNDSVLALSNVSCPAMIPVAGRPVIQWTMDYLRSLGLLRYRIAVPRRGLFVEEFVDCTFGRDCEVEYLVPSRDGGLGLTVSELADGCATPSALVVLGDTNFTFVDPVHVLDGEEPVVLVEAVEESYRWCVADITSDGTVEALHDKVPGLTPPVDALIGVYHFPDVDLLRRAACAAVQAHPERTEMSHILDEARAGRTLRAVRAGHWLDCGNPDRQAASARTLLQQRAFNELSMDDTLGTITKHSRHVEKFVHEINYLRLLPPDLSVLFPRVVTYDTEWDAPSLTLEFYGYPTLAELFVFENVDPGIWRRVFLHLHDLVSTAFMSHRRPLPTDAVRDMYLRKPFDRLAQLTSPSELVDIVQGPDVLVVNGEELANLPALRSRLSEAVDRLTETAVGTVIHGDLCFSNVLYDLRAGVCKLIDPRGSFGEPGIFGDPRYDVAKLHHSVHGLYDFITADLFRVSVQGRTAELDVRSRPQHAAIAREFDRVFLPSFDPNDIALISGLILVGLPPLHYDVPTRQLAFYLRGLQLLNQGLGLVDPGGT